MTDTVSVAVQVPSTLCSLTSWHDPADIACPTDASAPDQTAKLRIDLDVLTSAVAPAVDFTLSLKPVTAVGGASGSTTTTLGADVAGSSVAVSAPAATTLTHATVEFDRTAAGYHEVVLVTSGTTAASSTTVVRGTVSGRAI